MSTLPLQVLQQCKKVQLYRKKGACFKIQNGCLRDKHNIRVRQSFARSEHLKPLLLG